MKSKEEEEVARHQQRMREIWKEEEEVARHQQRMREVQKEKEVAQERYGPISSVGCFGSGAEEVRGEAEPDPGSPVTAIQKSHCYDRVGTDETPGTQMDDLPDKCLVHILRCLNTSDDLPHRMGEEVDVDHPLQCCRFQALACLGRHHHDLTALPESIGRLAHLTALEVGYFCEGLTSLPNAIGHLSSLKMLDVWRMKTWPESSKSLPALRTLFLNCCETLPDCFCGLTSLVINGGRAPSKSIFSTCDVSSLHKFTLHPCGSLSVCLDGLGMIGGLRELYLTTSGTLQALPESLGRLTNLEVCAIENFDRLRLLPEVVGNWRKLTRLEVQYCRDLQALSEVLGQIPLLKNLKVVGCPSLVSLPSAAGCFSSLEVLNLSGCKKLTRLPDAVEGLGSLRRLVVLECDVLELPECLWQRSGLRIDDRRRKT